MNTLRYFDFGSSRSLLLLIARIAVVVLFILFGYPKLLGFSGTVQYMASSGHLYNVFRKLSVKNRTQAVSWANEHLRH